MFSYIAVGLLCLIALTSGGTINTERHHLSAPVKIDELNNGKSSEIFEIIPIQTDLNSEGASKLTTAGANQQYPNLQEILNRYLKSNKDPEEQKYGEKNPGTQDQKYKIILKEVAEAKPEEQRYDEQNPEPQEENEDDMKNNEEELKLEEQTYNKEKQEAQNQERILKEVAEAKPEEQRYDEQNPEPQEQEYDRILKEAAEAKPEEQRYNEQNSEPQDQEYDRILKEAAEAKNEEQRYDEENAEPQDEEEDYKIFNDDPKHKFEFDAISKIVQQTRNGPSRAEITEIKPGNEMLQRIRMDKPQKIVTDKPGVEERNKPLLKFLVPEAPSFSTRLSVPPLPISLSSIRSMMLKWPHEVPSIFKAPKIIYLGHR